MSATASVQQELEALRQAKGLSLRKLAREMDTSLSQVRRVLGLDSGGSITIRTLTRCAVALGYEVRITLTKGE